MIIPGFIISWITFPGVIVHELAHQLFCRFYGIKVVQVCHFRFGNPAGFVMHASATKPWHSVMVAIGPFFVNSVVGSLIGFSAALRFRWGVFDALDILLGWLGISIAMHSFPSTGDAQNIWEIVRSRRTPLHTKVWAVPVSLLIEMGAVGSIIWLDALWGVFLVYGVPLGIIKLFA